MDLFDKLEGRASPLGEFTSGGYGYYTFPKLEGPLGPEMKFNGKDVIVWSINDYLGIGNNEVVRKIDTEATSKYKRFLSVKNNRYFNALQVKFSYAITCHKSQGGQWNTVFIEQPYLPQGMDKEYLRWLYTAVTRAREKLYLIGFKDSFFE